MNLILISSKCIYKEGDNFYFHTTARQTGHLRTILKIEINQKVKVGVINKGKGEGIVVKDEQSHYVIQLINPVHLENPESSFIPIDVVLCMPRPKILDKLLQQLASVGVKKIIIVFSEYSNKCYESSKNLKNEEIKKSLQLGLEQAMCTEFPEVYIHYSFNSFFMNFEKYADNDTVKLCAHTDVISTNILAPCSVLNKDEGKILLLTGCERGFSDFEIYLLKKLRFQFVHLSDRILKCETAILVLIGQLLLLTENTALRPSEKKMKRAFKHMKKEIKEETKNDMPIICTETDETTVALDEKKEMEHKEGLTGETDNGSLSEIETMLHNILQNDPSPFVEQLKKYVTDYIHRYETNINNNISAEQKKKNLINYLLKTINDNKKQNYKSEEENKEIDDVVLCNEEHFEKAYLSLLIKQIKYKSHFNRTYNALDIYDEDGVYIHKTKPYVTKKSEQE